MRAAAVQSEVMSYTDTLIGAVSEAWDQVAAQGRAESDAAGLAGSNEDHGSRLRRASLAIKLATVQAAVSIGSSPNPSVGLADMITMVTLERMVLESPKSAELYGDETAAKLVTVYKEQEDKAWRIAAKAMTQDQQDELKDLIAGWRQEHPDATYVSNVRLEDFAARRQQTFVKSNKSSPGSLLALLDLDPLAGLDPAEREVEKSRLLAERLFFYASRSPQLVKWQVESLYQDFLRTPEAKKAVASMEGATDAATRVSKQIEDLPKNVAAERSAAVDQVFAKLAEERHAALVDAMKQLDEQRASVIADLDKTQGKLQGTLKQYQDAAETTQKAAATLGETVKAADSLVARFDSGPKDPKKDALADFRAAAGETGNAADHLNTLVVSLDRLLGPGQGGKETKLQAAVADVQGLSQGVIEHAFARLLVLVIVAPLACAVAAVGYRWTTRNWRGR